MSITVDRLKSLLDAQGVRYFLDPHRPVILANFAGLFGAYQVVFQVDLDGRFLLIRTLGYGSCPTSHPHCQAVLQVLGNLNFQMRCTKWGWDPSDGEIVACVDVWLEDASVTEKQFAQWLSVFLPSIDMAHRRIAEAMSSGIDPGVSVPPPPPPPPGRAHDDYSSV